MSRLPDGGPIGRAIRQAFARLAHWAKGLRQDAVALWFASKHPDTPWTAKALSVFVVAYALSPIDLIPDFIPVLGLLDDVVLLPGLIWLAMRLVPKPVMSECREQAEQWLRARGVGKKPVSRVGAAVIVALWIACAAAVWFWWAHRVG